ncbi:MAG: ribonuclease HII, partial [Pseudomonadota bacterium]|nr:ribonuclease HII [Pseudomonadota bacterium]
MNSKKGYKYIAGVDEVGRGTLAGPVVAAAVILSKNILLDGLNDSKKVSKKNREKLFDEICSCSFSWSVAYCVDNEIDSINILQATMLAMRR